ncbi:MAG: CoA transferase [Dehalococcoidales bacterium]|nr:MAG: CoA transferase [Dehalococcoidales bacterium]
MVQALEGIKVMETASVYAGPMAGRLLADWGADVVHIEHPVRGDIARSESSKRGGKIIQSDINYRFENFNRNKRSITLDLSLETGRQVVHKLLETADVYISNFRPRELKAYELEYETLSQLNPGIIHANVCGYGKKGPDRDLPGYEFTSYFPRTGMLHVLQTPGAGPGLPPYGLGDNVAGMTLACGIMTALFIRERTGVGQEVDVSLFQAGVYALSLDIAGSLVTGQDRQQVETRDVANPLVSPYRTKDNRWLYLGVSQPDLYWSRFCRAIGREDLEHNPRFATFDLRIENHIALNQILEEVFQDRILDEWKAPLNEAGLPWSPVQNLPETTADPQARANDFYVAYDHPTYGHIEGVANPIQLSKITVGVTRPAPELGQHTEEVLLEHNYTWEDIERFKQQGVIG